MILCRRVRCPRGVAERFAVCGAVDYGRSLQQVPKEGNASRPKDRQERHVRGPPETATSPATNHRPAWPPRAARPPWSPRPPRPSRPAGNYSCERQVRVRLLQRRQLGHAPGDVATQRTRPGLSPSLHGVVLRQLVPGQTLHRRRILHRPPLPSPRRMLLLH